MVKKQIVLQVGVKVLLKNSAGKYLLLRRNPKKYPEIGAKWDIPGGRINPGSTLIDNLKREVKEETGLNLVKTPKLAAAQDILKVEDRHVVRLTYVGEIEGEVKLDDESLDYKWFLSSEIYQLNEKELDSFLKELLNNKIIEF